MTYFRTAYPTSVSASISQVPRDMEPTTVSRLPVYDDRIAYILVNVENVTNIANSGKALSVSLRTNSTWHDR